MKTANPFQIPSCIERNLEQQRRNRFKKAVVGSVAAAATLLVALLIAGCMGEHAKSASTGQPAMAGAPESTPFQQIVATQPKRVTPLPAAPVASKSAAAPVINRPETIYLVRPGDTLSRIARRHQTTVRTIKAANGLTSDLIAVGMKLKLPTA